MAGGGHTGTDCDTVSTVASTSTIATAVSIVATTATGSSKSAGRRKAATVRAVRAHRSTVVGDVVRSATGRRVTEPGGRCIPATVARPKRRHTHALARVLSTESVGRGNSASIAVRDVVRGGATIPEVRHRSATLAVPVRAAADAHTLHIATTISTIVATESIVEGSYTNASATAAGVAKRAGTGTGTGRSERRLRAKIGKRKRRQSERREHVAEELILLGLGGESLRLEAAAGLRPSVHLRLRILVIVEPVRIGS